MPLTGAQAVARALADARCAVITHVPGHGATDVFEASMSRRIRATLSFHEEVAYALGCGAALCGARSAVVIKTHGLAKACNAVLSSLSCGVTAGLVVVLADDRAGARSDNIFDAESLLRGMGLPYATATADDVYDAVFDAFEKSEASSLPHAVLIDAPQLVAEGTREPAKRKLDLPPLYERDLTRHLVGPIFTEYQLKVLEARRAGRSPDDIERPPMPRIPDDLPPSFHAALADYRVFFDALRTVPRDFTAGDTSLCSYFGLPPYDAVDAVSYYGGAVPLAVGAWMAGRRQVWAVSGDFAFLAAGHVGLLEAAHRHAPVKLVIFADGKASATGGQPIPPEALDRVLAGYESHLHRVHDPRDPDAVRFAIDESMQMEGLRIILLRYS